MNSSTRVRIFIVAAVMILFVACLVGFPTTLISQLFGGDENIAFPTSTVEPRIGYTMPTPVILYYPVTGANETDLVNQIHEKGVGGYAGYTKWYVRWGWPGFGQEDCDLSKAWIDVKVTTKLPQWDPPDGTSPELVNKWAKFNQALYQHEMGHVENLNKALAMIQKVFESSDCLTADSAANAVLDKLRGWDVQYDDQTDHGRTQGAVFP